MALHRPPLICNRFEVVLVILLSFIIATRLVWLQIDEQPRQMTDEFFTTGNTFKRALSQSCASGVDTTFPYPEKTEGYTPLATGSVSPGLEAVFWGVCQVKRLSVEEYVKLAPVMIGATSFLVALTSRILTSTWVGGFVAASVVLSRGSFLEGTHLASSSFFVQFLVSLVFLLTAIYLRSRDARWLPAIFTVAITAILFHPVFALSVFLMTIALLMRTLNHAHRSKFVLHRSSLHFISIVSMIIIVPVLVLALRSIMPASTSPIGAVLRHLEVMGNSNSATNQGRPPFVTLLTELQHQDFHFQCSLALIAIAATWKRYLPRGSGFWAMLVFGLGLVALTIDGALRAVLLAGLESYWPMALKLTGAIAALEPVIIGTASAYAWFTLRALLMAVFPSYSSPPGAHDRIRDNSV